MPGSGIKLDDFAKQKAFNIILKKELPYLVLKLSEDLSKVEIDHDEKFYSEQFEYDELLAKLPEDSPRFVIFDFPHCNKDRPSTQVSKVVMVSWVPESAKRTEKFAVSSTVGDLRTVLGISKNYIEGDMDDINEAAVLNKFQWNVCPEDLKPPKTFQGPIIIE